MIIVADKDKRENLKKIDFLQQDKILIPETKNILEVTELIKKSDLVITPDTSIVHIATAFDKKSICIYRKEFGKEDKNFILWGPNSEKAKVIFVEEKVRNGEEVDINKIDLNKFEKEMERI